MEIQSDSIISLSLGSYSVIVTDINGCSSISSAIINEPVPLLSSIIDSNDVSCNGGIDGSATVSASGGTAPYTYLWSNGQTGDSTTGLGSGTYSVTVTDVNSCSSISSAIINEPAALVSSITDSNDVSCNGGYDGFASVSVSGGIAPYTYLWDNGETNASAFSLNVGIHNVIITDANGCTTTSDVNITEPIILTSSITSINDVSCNGGSDGTVMANVSGGTVPYTYSWDNGQTTDSVYNLSAGDYNVTITDYNGCSSTITATIYEPVPLNLSVINLSNISCNGNIDGSAVVSASGGTAPYSYLWDNGDTNSLNLTLGPGINNIVVTDSNGCITSSFVTILEPSILSSSTLNSHDVSCNGGSDGIGIVIASGGTQPYNFIWDNGFIGDSITNLIPGNYGLTITDANGCFILDSVIINQPTVLNSSISNTSGVNCFGGNNGYAIAIGSGGTPPYTYLWDNGQTGNVSTNLYAGTYNVTINDANNCSSSTNAIITTPSGLTFTLPTISNVTCFGFNNGQINITVNGGSQPYNYLWDNGSTSNNLSGLSQGNYNLTVTDSNGCFIVDSLTISEPSPILFNNIFQQNVSCFGGNNGYATVIGTGGTLPYIYVWDSLVTNQINDTAINLFSGNYNVQIIDNNGCTLDTTITISEPAELILSDISYSNVSCFGGNNGLAAVEVSGGMPPYVYLWDSTAGNQISDTAFNLSAGSHTISIYDANGCNLDSSVLIYQPNQIVSQEIFTVCDSLLWNGNTYYSSGLYVDTLQSYNGCDSIVNLDLTTTDIDLSIYDIQGDLYSNISGGSPPFWYQWSNGQNTSFISPTSNGIYWLIVFDANQCVSDTAYFDVTFLTSIETLTDLNKIIKFYPNPATNLATVFFEGIIGENITLELYNLVGELIISEIYIPQSEFDSFNIDISYLNNGMYNVIIKVGESITSKKLQVIR